MFRFFLVGFCALNVLNGNWNGSAFFIRRFHITRNKQTKMRLVCQQETTQMYLGQVVPLLDPGNTTNNHPRHERVKREKKKGHGILFSDLGSTKG